MNYELNNIYNIDNNIGIKLIDNESIDVILTDPPYLYLKKQKCDISFNEDIFKEFYRILKPNGFVILFGRGTSFYRWNTKLAEIGFKFLEEIIWDKRINTGPFLKLNRVHETVSIHTKKNGLIKKSMIPYIEKKQYEIESIINDIRRIESYCKNENNIINIEKFLETKIIDFDKRKKMKFDITTSKNTKSGNRAIYTLKAITDGMKEASIMSVLKESYNFIHPTQKPYKLLERLLNIVINKNDRDNKIIFDPFAGSGSVGIACKELGLNYILMEIDKDYFEAAKKRIEKFEILNEQPKPKQDSLF